MGSLFGGGSASRAAKEQAKAIREQTRLQTMSDNLAASQAAQQMTQAAALRAAQQYADQLLATPQEAAEVNLAATDEAASSGDITRRRRSTRQSYQMAPRNSGLSVL